MKGPLLGGILMGGSSRRMGQPKQLLQRHGRSWFRWAVDAIRPHTQTCFALGEGTLPDDVNHLTRLPDATESTGPLAGIIAALRHRPDAVWIISACDMPQITPEAVAWLVGERRPDAAAVMPVDGQGRAQPLLALYEARALPLLLELTARGTPAPRLLAQHDQVWSPRVPERIAPAWTNVNHPQDMDGLDAPAPGLSRADKLR